MPLPVHRESSYADGTRQLSLLELPINRAEWLRDKAMPIGNPERLRDIFPR
jgi:hypothetical protein